MVNYADGVIYMIKCRDENVRQIYIGSTCDFIKRRDQHKSDCKKGLQPVHRFINETGGWGNWSMKLIEKCPCENKEALESRERYYLEILGATLNCCVPQQTAREYHKTYYEKNKNKKREYYEKNKDKIRDYQSEYKKTNVSRQNAREYQKTYYEKNKDKIREYKETYRIWNKSFDGLNKITID